MEKMGSSEAAPDSGSRSDVQASPVSTHRNDREHMRVRSSDVPLSWFRIADHATVTVPAALTPILITARKATRVTSQRACALFVLGMIHTSRHEDAWNN